MSFDERSSWAWAGGAAVLMGVVLFTGWPAPAFGQPYIASGRIDPGRVNVLSAADARRSAGLSLAFPVSHLKPEVVGWTRPDQSLRWTITSRRPPPGWRGGVRLQPDDACALSRASRAS